MYFKLVKSAHNFVKSNRDAKKYNNANSKHSVQKFVFSEIKAFKVAFCQKLWKYSNF